MPPVTDEEIEPAPANRSRDRVQVRNEIPASKPAFAQFLVDDDSRYWFGRPTTNPDSTAWWVAVPKTKRVMTDTSSPEVQLLTVQDDQAYGTTTTNAGAPAVVPYRVRPDKELANE